MALSQSSASAQEFPEFWNGCTEGQAAGQCHLPTGLATSPVNGHIYVADSLNGRVEEFTAWNQFVKSWGWGVRDGAPELQVCTAASGCQEGLSGGGAGEFAAPRGIAVDSEGNVYVVDISEHRIQKFDPEGHFLLGFGGDVLEDGAAGTGTVTTGSTAVTSVATTEKAFRVGQKIEGTGIEPGTTIASLGNGTITLSRPAGPAASGATTALAVAEAPENVPTNEKQTISLGENTSGGTFTLAFAVPDPSPSEVTTSSIPYNASAAEVQAKLEALGNLGSGNVAVSGPAGGPWTVEFRGARFADTDVAKLGVGASALTTSSGSPAAEVKSENAGEVCRLAVECRTGSGLTDPALSAAAAGSAPGQFSPHWSFSTHIAIGPGDEIFVGDEDRIQVFDAEGEYQRQLPLPKPGDAASLAVDPVSGDVYMAYPNSSFNLDRINPGVFRLDENSGALLSTIEVGKPSALATDAEGNLYVFDQFFDSGSDPDPRNHSSRVLIFNSAGQQIGKVGETATGLDEDEGLGGSVGIATGSACFGPREADLYVSRNILIRGPESSVKAFGPPPSNGALCPPPPAAPSIDAQLASQVGSDFAVLKAQINPHYWSGSAGQTRYYLQYATRACIEAEGWEAPCVSERPAPPGALLQAGVFDLDFTTEGIQLSGLQAATAYRYRFLAEGDGAPGVQIVGRGGSPGEPGADAGFRTAALSAEADGACANQAFRTGASAALPDCRAYELVSPVDKAGGDIRAPRDVSGWPARLDQAAAGGEAITYSSSRPFAGAVAAPFVNQYLTRRDPAGGWQTQAISPAQEGAAFNSPLMATDTLFKAFTPDLRYAWLLTATEPLLAPGGLPGYLNLYRRDNTDGSYQACTTAPPQAPEHEAHPPQMQGASADQSLAIFRTRNELTPDAAPTGNSTYQLYACAFGAGPSAQVHLLSVLPDGSASELDSTGGSPTHLPYASEQGRGPTLEGDVSADGSRVYWTATGAGSNADSPGTLYLRLNPTRPESARLHGSARGSGDLVGPATATGNLTQLAKTIQGVQVKSGSFGVGQGIAGPGIPAGTTVTAVELGAQRIKISQAATATLSGSGFQGLGSEIVTGAQAQSGAFAVGQTLSGEGVPPGTTIEALEETAPGTFKLILSAKATGSGTAVPLSAASPCTEIQNACTVQVSGRADAEYVAASPDGNRALYLEGGELHLFTLSEEGGRYEGEDTAIAGGEPGVVGQSADLSRIYLTSTEALAPGAAAGKPNLYLYEGGGFSFLATLAARDVIFPTTTDYPTPISRWPTLRTSRVSPDGQSLTFMSSSPALAERSAEYDNTDQASGEADFEVYRYSARSGSLDCVSCNPTGQRPAAREPSGGRPDTIWTASRLAPWNLPFDAPRDLSADGTRVFFESPEALAQADTNGTLDVYEWEQEGSGSCGALDPRLAPGSGGCIYLISSGKSPADSEFVDASSDGRDVFIRTSASLLAQDPGQIDIYDAREGGGFPQPPAAAGPCEGEACQSPPGPPDDPTPASSTFQGSGNVKEAEKCPQGKVLRKSRCVKKRHRHKKHHNRKKHRADNGRAGR